MRNERKPVRAFTSEAEERAFWKAHDAMDYVDWGRAERVRLPAGLLERIKVAVNERDVPYRSLIEMWLAEKVDAG